MIKKTDLSALFTILFLFLPVFLSAQKQLPVKLGLKLSPNIAWMNPNTKNYTNEGGRIGATAGFVSDFYFAERYAFSTGVNFVFLNGRLAFQDSMFVMAGSPKVNGTVDRKYNFIYLEIPLMVKMQTKNFGDFSFFGQIGFGTGFRLRARANDVYSRDIGEAWSEKNSMTEETTLIRESILFGFGAEYHLDQSSRIFLGLSYSNSLNNILTGVNSKSKLNEKSMLNFVELNLGFLF